MTTSASASSAATAGSCGPARGSIFARGGDGAIGPFVVAARFGRLDEQHFGAQRGQQGTAGRGGDAVADFYDANVLQPISWALGRAHASEKLERCKQQPEKQTLPAGRQVSPPFAVISIAAPFVAAPRPGSG